MKKATFFASSTCIKTTTSQNILISDLLPFIRDVSLEIEKSSNLKKSVSKVITKHQLAASFFDINFEAVENSFELKKHIIFPETNKIEYLTFFNKVNKKNFSFKIKDESVLPIVQQLFCFCGSGNYSKEQIRAIFPELFDCLIKRGIIEEKKVIKSSFNSTNVPGILRLQHASLLYRTKTTGILVDPHLHSNYELFADNLKTNATRLDLEGQVDAILISHSHEDHWHLSTLMMFPSDIPIIVPKVPKESIICDNFQKRLHSLGFTNVIAVEWYSPPIKIGDIEINVLPFYGEQPLLYERPKFEDLRNWGNTYLIKTEYYTSWFLIDSGIDSMGSMIEVAKIVQAKFGDIDILLSNVGKFYLISPLYISGGSYWLSLSAEQMQNFPSMKNHCVTLGAEGVARIAQILNASYFLPYAHLWNSLGKHGSDEISLMQDLKNELKHVKSSTSIVPWKIGDTFVTKNGEKYGILSYSQIFG